VALAGGQDVVLDAANEHGVGRLLGDEALQAAFARHPLGFDDLASGEGGGADVADLALADEVGEGAEGLLDVGVGARPVDLVEVDVVGLEAAQGVFDGADDPAPRAALPVGVVAHGAVELGGEDDVVAASLDGFSDDLFGFASGVDVGGVDEVDAGVEGGVDDAGWTRRGRGCPRRRTSLRRGTVH